MPASDWIRQRDALIQYYLRIDPSALSDEEWARTVKNLEWAREQEHLQSIKQIGKLF
jgi:hypothetical protein